MRNRWTLAGCAALALACGGWPAIGAETAPPPAGPVTPASTRPNVLVIMADDLGYADVSTYHKGRIPTPNIDRIGRDGVVFTQGYVSTPICSPSRAALMTGRHQQRYGFEYNNGPAKRDVEQRLGLDPRELTLGNVLRDGGYRTGVIGKWHLGSTDEHYPTNRGFDRFWGFLTGQTNFIRPTAANAVNAMDASKPGEDRDNIAQPASVVSPLNAIITGPQRTVVENGDAFLTEQLTEQAIRFIDEEPGKPFFLYLPHHAPHTPLQVTRKYYDRFPNIKDEQQRIYAGMVSALDDGVGQVLDHLEKRGLARNTIVVFLSDNGCAAYLPGICSTEPLSGGKLSHYEGGIRVPFLMRWPARVPAGLVYDAPVSSMDVFPTAVAAAGLKLPGDRPYDGLDLLPQIARAATPAARPTMFWRSTPLQTVREGDWKFHRDFDGVEYLYNLRSDPKELRNLAAAQPARVAAMKAAFAAWETDKVAPKWPGRFTEYDHGGRHFKFKP